MGEATSNNCCRTNHRNRLNTGMDTVPQIRCTVHPIVCAHSESSSEAETLVKLFLLFLVFAKNPFAYERSSKRLVDCESPACMPLWWGSGEVNEARRTTIGEIRWRV